MLNKEIFIEKLNNCGEVKYEMSEVQGQFMSGIKSIYNIVFKREKKDFLLFKNMKYFKSGIGDPDAKAKLHILLDNFISLLNHYDFIDDSEIVDYLKAGGVDVSITKPQFEDNPIIIAKEDRKKYYNSWKYAMRDREEPASTKAMLKELIDEALSTQKVIENKKSDIDKDVETVEVECMVKKPYFTKAIQIKVKEMKKQSVDNEIKKIEDAVEATQEIIEMFCGGGGDDSSENDTNV